jgi:hypothetical protein
MEIKHRKKIAFFSFPSSYFQLYWVHASDGLIEGFANLAGDFHSTERSQYYPDTWIKYRGKKKNEQNTFRSNDNDKNKTKIANERKENK